MATSEYVVAVEVDDVEKLGRIRGHTEIAVFVDKNIIWVKECTSRDETDSALQSLPGRHFLLRDSNDLIPVGHRLVSERLANPVWVPLS